MRRPNIKDRVKFSARCPKCRARFDIALRSAAQEQLCLVCKRFFLPDQVAVVDAAKVFSVLYRYLGWDDPPHRVA
jgi:hypothetical protein